MNSDLEGHPGGSDGNGIPRDGRNLLPQRHQRQVTAVDVEDGDGEGALVVDAGRVDVEDSKRDECEQG